MKYMIDPKTGEPSVSLTMLNIAIAAYLIAAGLSLVGIVSGVGPLQEFLYTTTALYFGRRFSFGSKGDFGNDSSSKAAENK